MVTLMIESGHLKFWKKKPAGIEFAKHFRSHLGPIEGLAVSADGLLCCTISNDRSVKIYDVVNYDMMVMIRLSFVAGSAEWVYRQGDVKPKLAISDRNTPAIHIFDAYSGSNEPIMSKEVTIFTLFCLRSSSRAGIVILKRFAGAMQFLICGLFADSYRTG
jgi:peptidylprolyl isomerase domain and WD repeat-containing protein 1